MRATTLGLSAPRERRAAPPPARAGLFALAGAAIRRAGARLGAPLLRSASGGGSYTERILAAAHAAARGELSGAAETAAREVAGRRIARIFQSARLRAPAAPALAGILTPACLGDVARRVVMQGEAAALVWWRGANDAILLPADDVDVQAGGADPATWLYQLSIPAPTGTITGVWPRGDVFHVAQDPDLVAPWRGTSPSGTVAAAEMPARARRGLSAEHAMPANRIIPTSGRGQSKKDKDRQLLERGLVDGGFLAFPETLSAGLIGDRGGAPHRDWDPRRMGPEPTAPQLEGWLRAEGILLAAHGLHPSLIDPRATATAIREARRQLQEEVEGIARLIEAEARRVFGVELQLWWETADDVELIRARTADALAGLGVDAHEALAASGFGERFTIRAPARAGEGPGPSAG